ncbi:hypothetical protein PMAC_001121 [Pneumocystis sp. 'macacae']|nr:hypothetical protein PMAC_001121 [Pneumocystis sp. 'macacae']
MTDAWAHTLHATLFERVPRDTVPRHCIACDAPLFFRCIILDELLSSGSVFIAKLGENQPETRVIHGLIERVGRRIYAFCRFMVHVTYVEKWLDRMGSIIEDYEKNTAIVPVLKGSDGIDSNVSECDEIILDVALIGSMKDISVQQTIQSDIRSLSGFHDNTDHAGNTMKDMAKLEEKEIHIKDIQKQLKQQYFEILYNSKVSLAYFAKIALTKARTQCQTNEEMLLEMSAFIESSLLQTPMQLETKFKKWLPMIMSIEIWQKGDTNERKWPDEVSEWLVYEDEQSFIMRWCGYNEKERFSSYQNNVDKKIEALKIREFQLQIILVLEVLSLRREIGNVTQDPLGKPKNKPKSESISIEQYLDVLVDRLCIWQALGDTQLLDDKNTGLELDNDQLKQFCAEVVMPFFPHHILRKRTKRPQLSAKRKSNACLASSSVSSSELFTGSLKTPVSATVCPVTALVDKKIKPIVASTTLRFPSTDKHIKGISRDGILNSKQSLEHREIKMPLKPTVKKGSDRTDDISLHASSVSLPSLQFRCTDEVRRTRVKRKNIQNPNSSARNSAKEPDSAQRCRSSKREWQADYRHTN